MRWTEDRAERELRSLELFGMRFGLEKMRRMMTALERPERRLATIHVLGTNGKSSTTRMIAAILQAHGLRTGAYLSPHLVSYRERILIGLQEISADRFGAAIQLASRAAERVNRTLGPDDHVTQFELLTAAAIWELAEREVEVAVVEAGLGGRYDATSVVPAAITVLTNVGLEHTRWLGPTVEDIAEEKLAALGRGARLVLGEGLPPEVLAVAERVAAEREAAIADRAGAAVPRRLAAAGAFQRRNFALARTAAESHLRLIGVEPDERAIEEAAAITAVPGRLEPIAGDPRTVLDGAHNPDAVQALVESLGEVLPQAPLALVIGVLEDKDAASMLRLLLPLCAEAWFTAPPSTRALSPAALQSLARQLGLTDAGHCEPDPHRALAAARRWAAAHRGCVLVTGSVYLVGSLRSTLLARDPEATAPEAIAR